MKPFAKVPVTQDEMRYCHQIREYVLRESFQDEGILLDNYDSHHSVHHHPNISLILVDRDKIVGSVRMDKEFKHLKFKSREVRLALFGIRPELQGKGLGKIFFDEIKVWCRSQGIDVIYTNSRLSSRSFWAKMGFVERIWDAELECDSEVQMVLSLSGNEGNEDGAEFPLQ